MPADLIDRLNPKALAVVNFAMSESRKLSAEDCGTEFLLLGLLDSRMSIAARALNSFSLGFEDVKCDVEKLAQHAARTSESIAFSRELVEVLELADLAANKMNVDYIGTEHLLLGIIDEACATASRGGAALLLSRRGVDLQELRQRVLDLFDEDFQTVSDSAGEDEQLLPITSKSQLPLFKRSQVAWSELFFAFHVAIVLASFVVLLVYLPAFWREPAIQLLGLPYYKSIPHPWTVFGIDQNGHLIWAHWRLVLMLGVLVFALLRLDLRLRCPKMNCSDEFIRQLKIERNKVPKSVQSLLLKRGFKIVATPSVATLLPVSLWSYKSRHEKGKGIESVLGVCHQGMIVVAEFYKDSANWKRVDVADTLFHEVGHAVDECLKVSSSDEFRLAVKDDWANMSDSDQERFVSYFESRTNGPSETFAELGSYVLGASDYLGLRAALPKTYTFVQRLYNEEFNC